MKKLFSTIITLIGSLCAYGQDTDSLQKVIVEPLTEIQRDSLLTNLEKRVHQIADEVFWIRCFARYKVYRTFNIYVRPYKLLSKYPTGKGLGKCSLKNLSSPDLSERETGRGV